jgi:hypothetical protein
MGVDKELVRLITVVIENPHLVCLHIPLVDAALLPAQNHPIQPPLSTVGPVLLDLLGRVEIAAFGRAYGADAGGDASRHGVMGVVPLLWYIFYGFLRKKDLATKFFVKTILQFKTK